MQGGSIVRNIHARVPIALPYLLWYPSSSPESGFTFCLSQLHYASPDTLKEVSPEYIPAPGNDGLEADGALQPETGHYPAVMMTVATKWSI